jgi:cytochrome c556
MKRLALAAAAGLTAIALVLPAAAQFQKPEDAIKYRKSVLTVMGNHFGRIGAMANGKVPFDAKAVQANAELVATLSMLPWSAFGDDTKTGGETRAKPEIWAEMDKFKAAQTKMQDEVAKLNVAAKTGNPDQIKAAFGDAGKSCKACHDNYRKE